MRKLIETHQKTLVTCDNPKCDFTIEPIEGLSLSGFLDIPCPKCGENLLTESDLLNHLKVMRLVNWINKWFSWITIFYSKKSLDNAKTVRVDFHHGGIHLN